MKTRLTLAPGANGTKELVARYGDRLVCVRYRYDAARRLRIKTVELIEEEAPLIEAGGVYLVKIRYEETALREQIRQAGARWDPARKLSKTTGAIVRSSASRNASSADSARPPLRYIHVETDFY
ncbi:MAG TPA: hypothetical protein VF701_07680 [Thermoanaerobaculia bacterium]